MTKNDQYILDNYYRIPARRIGITLGMTKGSVVTRYVLLTGKRKGNEYRRDDGVVVRYKSHCRPKVVAKHPPVLAICGYKSCQKEFPKHRNTQRYCDVVCREREKDNRYRRNKTAKRRANGSQAATI